MRIFGKNSVLKVREREKKKIMHHSNKLKGMLDLMAFLRIHFQDRERNKEESESYSHSQKEKREN